MNYYNEIDKKVAAWLRELIKRDLIAPGEVDERSIEDVVPSDLKGFTQCHFFAGIGGWSYALRLAGWPDDKPVWTGSCPCQPFSTAGKGAGFADERHLWPAWFHLIKQCGPPVIFGEQVEAAIKHGWLDLVQSDLEGIGYAFGAAGIPAAGVGAPHIRQRLWFVADARSPASERDSRGFSTPQARERSANGAEYGDLPFGYRNGGAACRLADRDEGGRIARGEIRPVRQEHDDQHGRTVGGLDDPKSERPGFFNPENVGTTDAQINLPTDTGDCQSDQSPWERLADSSTGPTNGFWRDADWLLCRDGKWRPVEPGTFPLAHGVSERVVRLRGYGNAINPYAAKAFIEATQEALSDLEALQTAVAA